MSIPGPIKVHCEEVFPYGLGIVGEVTAVLEYEEGKSREEQRQERDKETGLPLWTVDIMNFDPGTRERTFKVKIPAPVQPVPPDAVADVPVRPVFLEGLTVSPYRKDVGKNKKGDPIIKIVYAYRATAMVAPRPAGSKPAADSGKGA